MKQPCFALPLKQTIYNQIHYRVAHVLISIATVDCEFEHFESLDWRSVEIVVESDILDAAKVVQ